MGCLIIHQFVRTIEKAACSELMLDAFLLCFIQNHSAAKRSVDAREGHSLDGVDEHFVPSEDSLGVGARVAVDLDAKDDVAISQIVGRVGGDHFWVSQGRNAVLKNASPNNLVESNARLAIVIEIFAKFWVQSLVELFLEVGIVWRGFVVLRPEPILPGMMVVVEALVPFGCRGNERVPVRELDSR